MYLEAIGALLNGLYPTAYLHFKESEPQKPPYLLYGMENENVFYADGKPYYRQGTGWLELYTSRPELKVRAAVEAFFLSHKIPFRWVGEDYISSEKLYICVYHFEFEKEEISVEQEKE